MIDWKTTERAGAWASCARLESLLGLATRMQVSGTEKGEYAARRAAQGEVAVLYGHLAALPAGDPAAQDTHHCLDQVDLSFLPGETPPSPAYAARIEVMADARAIHSLRRRLESVASLKGAEHADLRAALTNVIADRLVHLANSSHDLPDLPADGWSRRQARIFDSDARRAKSDAIADAAESNRLYRSALPVTVMPALQQSKFIRMRAGTQDKILNELDSSAEDHIQIMLTSGKDAEECPMGAVVGLVFRERRYLKLATERYPEGYPPEKAAAGLRRIRSELEATAERSRSDRMKEFCAQTARELGLTIDALSPPDQVALRGRLTRIQGNLVTVTSVTQAMAPSDVLERARDLVEREVEMRAVISEQGALAARSIEPA